MQLSKLTEIQDLICLFLAPVDTILDLSSEDRSDISGRQIALQKLGQQGDVIREYLISRIDLSHV